MTPVDVETLVVMATNRGQSIVDDQVAAVRWTCERPYHVVIVDDVGDVESTGDDCTVIKSKVARAKRMSGFKNQEGIAHAIDAGCNFRVALCLDDDTLLIGRGLDSWALGVIDDGAVDVLGVGDRASYTHQWAERRGQFTAWVPEARGFVPHPETLFYPATWMVRGLCDEMHERGLLVPAGYATWDLWPDVYLSWVAQVLGFHCVAWGTMDMPAAPLYANHPDMQRYAPQPWILHPGFKAYHSSRAVHGATERQVRALYARRRAAAVAPATGPGPG